MKRSLTILFLIISLPQLVFSQSGSFIYSRYSSTATSTTAFWNEMLFPTPANGKAFVYPKADTNAISWNNLILSIFKYSPSNYFPDVKDSIQILQDFQFCDSLNNTFNSYYLGNPYQAFKQLDPIQNYTFSLQNIIDTAYVTFTPKSAAITGSDTEICFFIIPGSGDNQTSAIVRGEGYHNMNCNVMTTLKKHGDIYVYTKPNEDFRAIRIQQLPAKKMITDLYPTDSYLNQYLISNSKHEGINYLIECVAAIKQLKKKYKKVFVLGCSQGGYAALYASLETEVDGVLVSSGYSVKLDDNYLQFGNMALKFAQLPFELLKDSIKRNIRSQKSSYYFSWPNNDSPIYLAENQLHHTENYFNQGAPLTNVKYLYMYANHAFPPCNYIDSFVNEVKVKPKAFITDTLNQCVYDSMVRRVEFLGTPPFNYSLYKNDTLIGNFTSATKNDTITFYQDGIYQIKNITSANNANGIWSDKIEYHKIPHAGFQLVSNSYVCDSLKRQLNFSMQGSSPFQLRFYVKDTNGVLQLESDHHINASTFQINKPNNKYYISFKDSYGCEVLNDSILIQDTTLHYSPISEQYNCTSHFSEFNFSVVGQSPFTIQYVQDGVLHSQIVGSGNNIWQLQNANYLITSISDANNCDTLINQSLFIHYDSLSVTTYPYNYNCITDQFEVQYAVQGNSPFSLNYLSDTSSIISSFSSIDTILKFQDINYQPISISDATGCLYQFASTSYSFLSDTLEFNFNPPIFDCDSNQYKIHFDLEGNPPYTLFYKKNGMNLTTESNSNSFDIWLGNGNYLIEKVVDSKLCTKDTNQFYSFSFTPLQANILQSGWSCDSSKFEIDLKLNGAAPWNISYHDLGSNYSIITSDSSYKLFLENGEWMLDSVKDSHGCLLAFSPIIYHANYFPIEANFSAASFNCDSNKNQVQVILQGNPPFTIYYLVDFIPSQTTFISSSNWMLSNGNYIITHVEDATGCFIDTSIGYYINSQPLQSTIVNQFYNCDSSLNQIDFNVLGDGPFQLSYSNSTSSFTKTFISNSYHLMLPNDTWMINKISDANGCQQIFNTAYNFGFTPLTASITSQSYNCDISKLKVQFALSGDAPWVIHTIENSITSIHHFDTTSNPNFALYLPFGNFSILDITDAKGCSKLLMQNAINSFHPLLANLVSTSYQCDSNKLLVKYSLGGTSPWMIQLKNLNTGNVSSYSTYDSMWSLLLPEGDFAVESISDQNCLLMLNDTIINHIQPLTISIDTPVLNCNLSMYGIDVTVAGGVKPYQFSYLKNGQPIDLISYSNANHLNLPNANYYFTQLKDSLGCSITLNQFESIQYNEFNWNGVTSSYLCDKNVTQLNVDISHISPVWLIYTNPLNIKDTLQVDSNPILEIGNGSYTFVALYDSLGCFDTIQYSIQVENYPIGIDSMLATKNCENRNYDVQFFLTGKAPWYLFYNYNNVQDTIQILSSNQIWQTTPGAYYWIEIKDNNNCSLPLLYADTLSDFLTETPTLILSGTELIATSGAGNYVWYKDNLFFDSTQTNSIHINGNGEYYAFLFDDENCKYQTNKIDVSATSGISLFPNPAFETAHVFINENFGSYWDYKLVDTRGNTIDQGTISEATKDFQLNHLESGIYNLIIIYESDFSKHILRLNKL